MNKNIEIILHIGAPKTASSAIQNFCIKHRELLKEKGFYYPEHGLDTNGVSGGHSQLTGRLVNKDIASAKNWFDQHLSIAQQEKKVLLISAEGMYGHLDLMQQVVVNLINKCFVIGYLRNPIESVISNHNQGVKRAFSTKPLDKKINQLLRSPASRFHSGEILLDWQRVFGGDNVCFKPFDSKLFKQNKIEYDFLDILGIDTEDFSLFELPTGKINSSYSPSAEAFKLAINPILDKNCHELNAKLDEALQAYSDRIDERQPKAEQRVGSLAYKRLQSHFTSSNESLKKQLFSDYDTFWTNKEDINETHLKPYSGCIYSIEYVLTKSILTDDILLSYLVKCLTSTDEAHFNDNLRIIQLCLDIEPIEITNLNSINLNNQLNNLLKDNLQAADYLRETALLFENLGFKQEAYKLINKALQKRPNGPKIIEIEERLRE